MSNFANRARRRAAACIVLTLAAAVLTASGARAAGSPQEKEPAPKEAAPDGGLKLPLTPQTTPPGTGGPQEPAPGDRAFLGLQTELATAADGRKYLRVSYIFPFSAAEGMDFKVGDEVVAINDVLTTDQEVFVNEVRKERIGTTLRFLVRRDGQTLKVNGKIGSYNKTMVALQDAARKERIGKPLPPPPAALWWNAATAVWEEKPGALADLKDKLAVVISFDNCGFCKEEKVKKVAAMKSALQQTAAGAPLAFTGFFFNEARTRDECLKDARELLQAVPVNFPVAVTYFPSPPAPEAKREQVLLTQHGVAILEPKGTVVYLQTYGTLGPDFLAAFQNAARGLPAGAKVEDPGAAGKPPGKP